MRFVKNLFGDLLGGFVFWFPIWIVGFVLSTVFGSIGNLGGKFLSLFLNGEPVHPGFGILLGVIIFYLTGLILKKTPIGDSLSRIPLLGLFFRKKGGEIITFDRLLNLTPCLFLYSPTCPSYGWILSTERVKLNDDEEEETEFSQINVYYPNVPTIITGQIFPVRKETVMKLGNPSREIIDLLLYALRTPENIQYLPWEDENEDDFRKRAKRFGLDMGTE